MSTATQTPALGDAVFFEGLPYKIAEIVGGHVRFVSDLTYTRVVENEDGTSSTRVVPRFETVALLPDLQWSSRYRVWYLWGRLLSKARGKVGDEQRQIVAELRDRGLLKARSTRERGSAPAGGEQLGLYYCLFAKPGINWKQEIANVRRGEGLSDAATAACNEFDVDIKCKGGFASPEDGDPKGTKGGQ